MRLARISAGAGRRRFVLSVALVATLAVGAATTVAVAARQIHLEHPSGGAATAASPVTRTPTAADRRAACLGAAARAADDGCAKVDLGTTTYPPSSLIPQDSGLQYDCFTPTYGKLVSCHYGSSAGAATRVAFVGDNRAASLLPGVLAQLPRANWSLTTYIGDGCVLSSSPVDRCSGAQKSIIAAVTKANAFDLVITTADRTEGLTSASFTSVFKRIRATGAKLAVVRDVPRPSSVALACSTKDVDPEKQVCSTPRTAALAGIDPLVQSASDSGASLVDLSDYFCTTSQCAAIVGNVVVYRDGGADLTTTFSRTLGPFIVTAITRRLGA